MATYTLFGQPASPSGSTGGAGATTGSYGLQFSVSSPAILQKIEFYSPPGATVLPDVVGLFDTSGNLVLWANPSWSGAAGSGWITTTLNAPPLLKASFNYVAVIHMPFSSGFWNQTDSTYWSSGAGASGITSGILSAPNNATAAHGQNSTVTGSAIAFPNTSMTGSNIWMDVQVADAPSNVYTIFKQNPVADLATNDNSTYTMAMTFQVTSAANATAIWFFSPYFSSIAADIPNDVAVYDFTASSFIIDQIPTWSGPEGSGWVRYQFSSPVALTVGHVYQVCIVKSGSGNNWYAAHAHYWDTTGPGASGITNGPLTAPNDATTRTLTGSFGQDSFHVGNTLAVPNGDFNATSYGIDIEVQTSGPTAISVTDFAGMVESPVITATVGITDFAGLVESISVSTGGGTAVFVSDFAGMVESPSITVTIPVIDIAGAVERITGSVNLSVAEMAAGLDRLINSSAAGTNLIRPAIVFMAATYPGST